MIRCVRAFAVVALLVTGVVLVGSAAPAGAVACTVEQASDTVSPGDVGGASVSDDGTKVVVSSFVGLDGDPNPGNDREIFVYDTVTATFTRITDAAAGTGDSYQAVIDDDGDHVAFSSSADLTGGNADHNQEVFLWAAPSTITQLTTTTAPTGSGVAAINGTGSIVAYLQASAGTSRIYLDDGPGADDPISAPATSTAGPTINDAGNRVAYSSNVDGNQEVYLYRASGPTTTQVTATSAGASQIARISDDGARITFTSNRNFGGGNADGSDELFQYAVGSATTTRLTGGPNPAVPSLVANTNAGGTRIVFNDNRDLAGSDGDTTQDLFVRDIGGNNAITQLTDTETDFPSSGDLNADGSVIAAVSNSNPTSDNDDGNSELFIYRCGRVGPSFNDVGTGNAFYEAIEWMTAQGIASGFPGGLFKPDDAVKRQQMANFLYNLAGQPEFTPPVTPTFNDVPTSNPFYLQIEWMNDVGVASGFPGGLFKPDDAVKRQQMAHFLYNLAGQPTFTPPVTPTYSDVPTSNPFYAEVEWMADQGIASGFPGGLFKPTDAVKRQQMARFVLNFANCCGVGDF